MVFYYWNTRKQNESEQNMYVKYWKVPSDSNPERKYVVAQTREGGFACDCVGWTRHTPRRDCKHILYVRGGHGQDYDPLLRSMTLAVRTHDRKQQRAEQRKEETNGSQT